MIAFAVLGGIAPPLAAQGRVTLTGLVTDSASGAPVERVTVYLPNGQKTETDREGRFSLAGVKADEKLLLYRRIGYAPTGTRLALAGQPGTIDLGTRRMSQLAQVLDSVAIQASLVMRNPRLDEFYRRRHYGRGAYLTRQQIWDKNPFLTSDLLRTMSGVQVVCGSGMGSRCVPASTRYSYSQPCVMMFLVDGIQMDADMMDDISPGWIAGIEVYHGLGNIPLDLTAGRTPGCGVVAIWTGGEGQ